MRTMKTNLIYPERSKRTFNLLTRSIMDCLNNYGFYTIIVNSFNINNPDVVFVIAPTGFDEFEKKKGVTYIAIQTEQFPMIHASTKWQTDHWNNFLKTVHNYDYIWDIFYELHSHLYQGINRKNVFNFNLGYHDLFDTDHPKGKLYDFSFIGTINERRRNILSKVSHLRGLFGVSCYGIKFIDTVTSSRINLNVHYNESRALEQLRVIMFLMSKGEFVLSEEFVGNNDLISGKYLDTFNEENFCDKIQYYLKNEKKRYEIAKNGYLYIKKERTLKHSVKECLEKSHLI